MRFAVFLKVLFTFAISFMAVLIVSQPTELSFLSLLI